MATVRPKKPCHLCRKTLIPSNEKFCKKCSPRYHQEAEFKRADDRGFYRKADWLKLRAVHLMCEPWCVECLKEGRYTAGEVVDHIRDRVDRPDLALDSDNLQTLCKMHHNRKTRIKQNEQRAKAKGQDSPEV